MRKVLCFVLLAMAYLPLWSANYNFLTFETVDGKQYSIAVSGLSISFTDGYMKASDGTSLPLSNINKMYFSNASGIDGQRMSESTSVAVYDQAGRRIATFSSFREAVTSLNDGMYLIQETNGKTHKKLIKR